MNISLLFPQYYCEPKADLKNCSNKKKVNSLKIYIYNKMSKINVIRTRGKYVVSSLIKLQSSSSRISEKENKIITS